MISVTEAKQIIKEQCTPLPAVMLPLCEAAGLTIAADVYSPINLPPFAQSSMDGYAIKYSERNQPLQIVGEMAAGAAAQRILQAGEACRIFTGAPVPQGADTVVMQEKVSIKDGKLVVEDNELAEGINVRPVGADMQQGALAAGKGLRLSPAAIGFLAGAGCTEISVHPRPSVHLIVTGNELQTPGKPLAFGQVYESNSFALRAALQRANISSFTTSQAADDPVTLQAILEEALAGNDVVLLTGGVSVGDYDFVVTAAEKAGVKKLFHRVKQRPGKPLFFGTKEGKLVFGLPGNPSSVISCFYQYVLPALEALMQAPSSVQKLSAKLAAPYKKKAGLTHFLKGHYEAGKATPLTGQESFRLHSFSQANCLICLPEEGTDYAAGDVVSIYLLPV